MSIKALTALSLLAFSTLISANTCPTQLVKEYNGFWISQEQPGWKSSEQTGVNTTVNTKDFGGAVYSPSQKRIACVYRTSRGYWIAMVSHTHKGFQINKHALDDARKHYSWKWDPKNKDYSCGRPSVIRPKNCEFTLSHLH